jgi:hypothetical protein
MSDRPDWLPEPPPRSVRSIRQRVYSATVSLASLLLGVIGAFLLLIALVGGFEAIVGPSSRAVAENAAHFGLAAIILLVPAAILRRILRRDRKLR